MSLKKIKMLEFRKWEQLRDAIEAALERFVEKRTENCDTLGCAVCRAVYEKYNSNCDLQSGFYTKCPVTLCYNYGAIASSIESLLETKIKSCEATMKLLQEQLEFIDTRGEE